MFFALLGCNSNANLDRDTYVHWVLDEDNGLVKKQGFGDWEIQCFFLPTPFCVLREEKNRVTNKVRLEKEIIERSGLYYFELKLIAQKGNMDVTKFQVSDDQDYGKRLNYLSFGMQHKLSLLTASGSKKCMLYSFEPTYGLQKTATINVAFEKDSIDKGDITLVYEAEEIGLGIVKFTFDNKTITSTPTLKL